MSEINDKRMLWLASHIDKYTLGPIFAEMEWIDGEGYGKVTTIDLGEFETQPDDITVFNMIVDKAMGEK